MADKRLHLAKMNAKGLEDALDDDDVRVMIESQGDRSLFLVEAVHGPYVTGIDGQQTLNLLPGVVVRVPDEHAKPVRDLLRGLAMGSGQTLTYDDAGDAFVPDTGDSAAKVQQAADAAAADPEAPLPTGAATGDEDGGSDGLEGDDRPWPGDGEASEDPAPVAPPEGDDLAAKRAKGTRGKAAQG